VKILGIDQSTKKTGYSIWEDYDLIDYGTFTSNLHSVSRRIKQMRDKIEGIIKEHSIDYVIVENVQQQQNPQTVIMLSKLLGAIEVMLLDECKEYEIVNANTWRSTLGIKGKNRNEQKNNSRGYVQEKFNVNVEEDVAEAICIGEYGRKQQEKRHTW